MVAVIHDSHVRFLKILKKRTFYSCGGGFHENFSWLSHFAPLEVAEESEPEKFNILVLFQRTRL